MILLVDEVIDVTEWEHPLGVDPWEWELLVVFIVFFVPVFDEISYLSVIQA